MKRPAVVAIALAFPGLAGCQSGPALDAPLPYIAVLKPPPPGIEPILLLAGQQGRIVISKDCVLAQAPGSGTTWLPVFYPGTAVGRDDHGLFLRDPESGTIFRHGNRFEGGGGEMPPGQPQPNNLQSGKIPKACSRERIATLNPGFRKQ